MLQVPFCGRRRMIGWNGCHFAINCLHCLDCLNFC